MTSEQAAKISADKTKIELEKLQETIKETNPFEKIVETPSDIEFSCSSEEEVTSKTSKRPRYMGNVSMEDRIYDDNQRLWKKNQLIKTELEKKTKQLRYLQFQHNNVSFDNKILKNSISEFDAIKKAYFYKCLQCFFAYLLIIAMMMQYEFEYPVIDYAKNKVISTSQTLFDYSQKYFEKY